jgi:hypothetical protein
MEVRGFTVGPVQENTFIVRQDGADEALIVDPGDESQRLLDALDELGVKLVAILITHTHFDHIGAVADLAEATGAPVWCPELELPMMRDPNAYMRMAMFGPFRGWEPEHSVSGGERLELAGFDIDVHFTPGTASAPSATRSPTSRRCSPVTCCSATRSAASTCRAATGRRSSARSERCSTATPTRRRSSGAHGADDARARAGAEPFLAQLAER